MIVSARAKRLSEEPVRVWAGPAQRLPPAPPIELLEALDAGTYAVGLYDDEDRLVYSNEAFRAGWAIVDPAGVTFASMIRHCHASRTGAVVDTDDVDRWLDGARRHRREGPSNRSFEVDLWDGRWMWVTERRLDSGWILFIAQDITALKTSERTLRQARDAAEQAALTDPLTGLPNRRSAMQLIDASISRKTPFHVALADIDNFKQINDRYGHQAGDDILVLFSEDLASLRRHDYFVARLAGDEFLIVGPGGETQEAFEGNLKELLRLRVEQCSRCTKDQVFGVSIGASSFPLGGLTSKELLIAADRAMYIAKSQGRCTLSFAA